MSRPLLELRGRRAVVLQMKVLQIALVRQLVAESFTFCEASSARSRESPDTSCSSVPVGSCHTGGPVLLSTGATGGGLGGTKGARSPSSVAGSRLSSASSFLGAGFARGWSSPSSETTV